MKKLILLTALLSFCAFASSKSLDDWSNEDLCRWIDAAEAPNQILLEIEIRGLPCLTNLEVIKVSIQEPIASEHGTVFPSPASQNHSNNNSGSGIRFIFNYKVTL